MRKQVEAILAFLTAAQGRGRVHPDRSQRPRPVPEAVRAATGEAARAGGVTSRRGVVPTAACGFADRRAARERVGLRNRKRRRRGTAERMGRIMLDTVKTLTRNQFDAALCTLNACIDRCPERAWHAPVGNLKFCQVGFPHAVLRRLLPRRRRGVGPSDSRFTWRTRAFFRRLRGVRGPAAAEPVRAGAGEAVPASTAAARRRR